MKRKLGERGFYTLISWIVFIINAAVFYEFIYELSEMVGSIVSGSPAEAVKVLTRMLPLQLTAFILVYISAYIYLAECAPDKRKRIKIWRINGLITILLGLIVIVYVAVGAGCGVYHSLVEGHPSALYPLDTMIGGLLMIFVGVMSVRYAIHMVRNGSEYFLTVRTKKNGKRRSPLNGWMVYSYLLALCGFAAGAAGFFVMDFSHGAIFFNISLWLYYLIAFVMYIAYRYIYIRKPEKEIKYCSRRMGEIFLIANIVLLTLYFISVQINNEAPNLNAYGLLPVEFAASFNAFPILYGTGNIAASVAAIIKGEKKEKC